MSNVKSVIGVTIAVSANTPATYDEAGFGALTFTEIGEVTALGEFGANKGFAQHQPLKTGITRNLPGFVSYGQLSLGLGRDATDAGQAILQAGVDGAKKNNLHSFKVTHQDGAIQYFTGYIGSYTTSVPGGNSVVTATTVIQIDNQIIEVDPV